MLTRALSERGRRVIAVEIDRRLLADLRSVEWPSDNVEIVGRDFLDYPLPRSPYKFFANVPFARTADVVRKLAFSSHQPQDAYLVMQVEAAVRFLGQPFGPESEISLLLKAQFEVSVVAWLNRTDFIPPPSVSSVLLRLNRPASPRVDPAEARDYRQFVRSAMRRGSRATESHLRSMLGGAPVRALASEMNFPLGAPPSEVSFEHWLAAFRLRNWNRIGDPDLR